MRTNDTKPDWSRRNIILVVVAIILGLIVLGCLGIFGLYMAGNRIRNQFDEENRMVSCLTPATPPQSPPATNPGQPPSHSPNMVAGVPKCWLDDHWAFPNW